MTELPVEKWLREQASAVLEKKDFGLCNNLNLAASYVEFLRKENAELSRALEMALKVNTEGD